MNVRNVFVDSNIWIYLYSTDSKSFVATFARTLRRNRPAPSIEAIFDLAIDCTDTDLSVNHDKYLYGDNQP